MTVLLKVSALLLVVDDINGLLSRLALKGSGDLGARDVRCADDGVLAVVSQKHLVEDDLVALLEIPLHLLDLEAVASRNLVLLAARLDYCKFVHSSTILHKS